MPAIHGEVIGLVQGVYFRASTVSEARRLHLVGWVRNRPSGTVEVWAQGPADAIERFQLFLERGPRGAVVEMITVETVESDPALTSFNVR